MPSPLGHALAGATIAWFAQSVRRTPFDGRSTNRLAIVCAEIAVLPDLDFVYSPIHRMGSHSITAVVLVSTVAGLLARRKNRQTAWPVAIVCGLAYGSHLAMDWLGGDTKLPGGIQLLWPFSHPWFISSWTVFPGTTLGGFFTPEAMLSNALTLLQEMLILAPIALVAWFTHRRILLRTGK